MVAPINNDEDEGDEPSVLEKSLAGRLTTVTIAMARRMHEVSEACTLTPEEVLRGEVDEAMEMFAYALEQYTRHVLMRTFPDDPHLAAKCVMRLDGILGKFDCRFDLTAFVKEGGGEKDGLHVAIGLRGEVRSGR